jgi:hypothetical protein
MPRKADRDNIAKHDRENARRDKRMAKAARRRRQRSNRDRLIETDR